MKLYFDYIRGATGTWYQSLISRMTDRVDLGIILETCWATAAAARTMWMTSCQLRAEQQQQGLWSSWTNRKTASKTTCPCLSCLVTRRNHWILKWMRDGPTEGMLSWRSSSQPFSAKFVELGRTSWGIPFEYRLGMSQWQMSVAPGIVGVQLMTANSNLSRNFMSLFGTNYKFRFPKEMAIRRVLISDRTVCSMDVRAFGPILPEARLALLLIQSQKSIKLLLAIPQFTFQWSVQIVNVRPGLQTNKGRVCV